MTKDEALRLALEALKQIDEAMPFPVAKLAQAAIKKALAEPEFTKHEVTNADDWSEWVCPDPRGYLMKCCDCGLVHEAEFAVVRYKSETEREDCDIVDDPNLQAVFRMRRSEEWTPEDTAHRSGGLPMAQPEQEPVAWLHRFIEGGISIGLKPADLERHPERWEPLYAEPKPCPTCEALARTVMLDQTSHDTTPPQRKPVASLYVAPNGEREFDDFLYDLPIGRYVLYTDRHTNEPITNADIEKMCPQFEDPMRREMWIIGFKAAHGIKENT